MVDAVAIGTDLANEKSTRLQIRRGTIDGSRIHIRLAEGEAQFGQMGHLIHLPAGRFEEDSRPDAAVQIAKVALGVRVQRLRMSGRTCQIGFDGRIKPGLAQLAQNHGAKLGYVERRRSQRNQRLPARPLELLARKRSLPGG